MRPVWKWLIGVVTSMILIVVLGAWYLSGHWKPILDAQLKEAILRSTDSLYLIAYDALDFNLITGNASIKNLRLTADTNRYAEMERLERAPDNIYHIAIANLRIRGFHPRRVLSERKLHVDDIIMDTPNIQVFNKRHAYNDTAAAGREGRTLYQRISSIIHEVSVSRILFNDIHFKFSRKTDSTRNETVLRNVNVQVSDVLVDSLSQFDTDRFYYSRAIDIDMPGVRYNTPDSFYQVSFDRLRVATHYKQVTLTGLKYVPRMSAAQFYRRQQQAKERVTFAFPTIRLEEVDLQRFVHSQQLHAGSLHIDSGRLEISNDLRHPKKTSNKIGKSPHQLLLKLKQPIKIDSVLLNTVDISYAEVSKKYGKEGKITFDRASGVFRNVTNDPAALQRNQVMEVDLTAYLMNAGRLNLEFAFDMLDKRGSYTYKGSLGPMDGRPLNRIITPLLNAQVARANIRGIRFDVKANDYRARGSLRFDYDNMRLNLLGNEGKAEQSSRKVISFLANSFIINDSNPDANGKYHTGRINYVRPETDSFFKMLWQSLLQGIKETAGISPERERRLMNAAEEARKATEKTGNFFKRIFGKKEQ